MDIRKRLQSKVVFQGGYDGKNTGDDAFAAIAAWGANHYWKTRRIAFLKQRIPQVPVSASALLTPGAGGLRIRAEMMMHIARTPTLIFAGGSVFSQASRGVWAWCRALSSIHKLCSGAIGVSVGPYPSVQVRKRIQETLKRFSFLVLRDRRSFLEACDLGLPYPPVEGFDMAVLLPLVYGPVTKQAMSDRPRIGVSVCHYERYVGSNPDLESKREQRLLEALQEVARHRKVCYRFLVMNGDANKGDAEITARFRENLRDSAATEVADYHPDPSVMWKAISECDAVIATRLHAGLFSYTADIPFLQVEYHPKCSDFLDDIGYPASLRLRDMEISPRETAAHILELVDKPHIPFSVGRDTTLRKAQYNFTAMIS